MESLLLTLTRYTVPRPTRRLALVALLAALLPVAEPSTAATQIYHSPGDDGVPAAGQASVPEGGVQSVYLYVDGGGVSSTGGTACDTGQGDEICGYEVLLSGLGGLTLASFDPDSAADVLANLGPSAAIINGLDTETPSAGPKRIGELHVNAASGGWLQLTSGESVGADLSQSSIASTTLVIVPEPGFSLLLASGVAMLGTLHKSRIRRCDTGVAR